MIHYNGIKANHGFGHYIQTFKVKLDREGKLLQILAPVIEFGVFWLEIGTAFIRAIILAVRLFANMLAGTHDTVRGLVLHLHDRHGGGIELGQRLLVLADHDQQHRDFGGA